MSKHSFPYKTNIMGFGVQEFGLKFFFVHFLQVWSERRFKLSQPQVLHLNSEDNEMQDFNELSVSIA
jgi:hypothetical protein